MGRSWYLRRALVLPGIALIIRAWWAVTFPLHWVRTVRSVGGWELFRHASGKCGASHSCQGGDILKENTCFFGNRTSACCLGVSPNRGIWAMAIVKIGNRRWTAR